MAVLYKEKENGNINTEEKGEPLRETQRNLESHLHPIYSHLETIPLNKYIFNL